MGSKNRYSNELLSIILKDRKSRQWYVEPFVGGFNMIYKVDGNRIANDINYYLIELFKAIQNGWFPPTTISEEEYQTIKNNKDKYPPWIVGFVGFGCSYGGKWFAGYARDKIGNRNYCNESRRSLLKQAQNLKDVVIRNKNYLELKIPLNSIIYCDPPYRNTTEYKDRFNHTIFWEWVRKKAKEGNSVFISEYFAPDDFDCIWQKQVNNRLEKNTGQRTEKLFKYKFTTN